MDKLKNEKFPLSFTVKGAMLSRHCIRTVYFLTPTATEWNTGTNTSICSTIISSRLSSVPREKNIREGRAEGLKIGREEGKALG